VGYRRRKDGRSHHPLRPGGIKSLESTASYIAQWGLSVAQEKPAKHAMTDTRRTEVVENEVDPINPGSGGQLSKTTSRKDESTGAPRNFSLSEKKFF